MTGLVLKAAAAVRAPQAQWREPADDPIVLQYFQDLLGPFGATPDKELLQRGAHVHHQQLADLLTEVDGVRDSSPQLLIAAHALPDVVPFTAIAPYLMARLGGEATSFSVGQQGLAAPFTALRIASAYQRSGRLTEAVVAILEQTTLPTPFPLVQDTPLTDSAAALVLSTQTDDGAGLRLGRAETDVSPEAALTTELARRPKDARTLVVLGSWVTVEAAAGLDVHQAAPGTYCTGVWLELAEHWRSWQEQFARIVLLDTDPRTGKSHLATFSTGLAPESAADGG